MDVDTLTNGGELFEDLITAEERFYKEGFQQGFDHGKLHGLFEGRELGREKGWEVWEEVGFYEGWAGLYAGVLGRKGVVAGGRGKESRALNHATVLLDLIAKFPLSNPSDTSTVSVPSSSLNADDAAGESSQQASTAANTEIDLPALLSSIRARYRLLCSSLNVRPRLTTAPNKDGQILADGIDVAGVGAATNNSATEGVVQGIEGPMKGVDTRQLRF